MTRLLVFVFCAVSAFAQSSTTAVLTGVVTDPTQAVAPVKVEKPGFLTQTKKGIELTVGQSASFDFQLAVGGSNQIVEISSEPPLIESERSQQANTIGPRDYLSFALPAPGISDPKGQAGANSFRVKQTPDSACPSISPKRERRGIEGDDDYTFCCQ